MLQPALLFCAFEIKRYLCSYVFQTPYMLRRVRDEHWIGPSLFYALFHAVCALMIASVFCYMNHSELFRGKYDAAIMVFAFDFACQFIIDRIYFSYKFLGKFQPSGINDFSHNEDKKLNWKFWRLLGLKSSAHNFTAFAIIFFLLRIM